MMYWYGVLFGFFMMVCVWSAVAIIRGIREGRRRAIKIEEGNVYVKKEDGEEFAVVKFFNGRIVVYQDIVHGEIHRKQQVVSKDLFSRIYCVEENVATIEELRIVELEDGKNT